MEGLWTKYVKRKLAATIQMKGQQIQLIKPFDSVLNSSTFVSRNMPYTIECNSILGGSVAFGTGENAIHVHIYGLLASIDSNGLKPPELIVHESSVAAKRLYVKLCPILSEYMMSISQQ